MKKSIVILLLLISSFTANGKTIQISLEEMNSFIADNRDNAGDSMKKFIAAKLQSAINEAGLLLSGSDLVFSTYVPATVVDGSCSTHTVADFKAELTVNGDSGLQMQINSLNDPIETSLYLSAHVYAESHVEVTLGARIFTCLEYGSDNFVVYGNVDAEALFKVTLELNPELIENPAGGGFVLRLSPNVNLDGEILSVSNQSVVFDNTQIAGLAENAIRKKILSYLTPSNLNQEYSAQLLELRDELRARMAEALLEPEEFAAWTPGAPIQVDYQVPQLEAGTLDAIVATLGNFKQGFPVSYDFILAHQTELVYYLLAGDTDGLKKFLAGSLACESGKSFLMELPLRPAPPEYEVQHKSLVDFCAELVDSKNLGNADVWDGDGGELMETPWQTTPATNFEVSVVSLEGNFQPYMKQIKYKTIENVTTVPPGGDAPVTRGSGVCKLEMRVYKEELAAQGQKPLMMLHGGSWRFRGAGFTPMEPLISHFTSRGYVVFAPFYRLLDEVDGNIECNGASGEDIITDIADAFNWVQANMGLYGAAGKPDVMGQSAGAYLAGDLALTRPQEVGRALLMYSPVDFVQAAAETAAGNVSVEAVMPLLRFLGVQSFDEVDLARLQQVSLNHRVRAAPGDYPPMHIVQGLSDELVPAVQATRLCTALSGSALEDMIDPGSVTAKAAQFACGTGTGSRLTLLAEAGHALEVCVPRFKCLAGSTSEGVAAAANTLQQEWDWLAGVETQAVSRKDDTKSGALNFGFILLLLVMHLLRRRGGLSD